MTRACSERFTRETSCDDEAATSDGETFAQNMIKNHLKGMCLCPVQRCIGASLARAPAQVNLPSRKANSAVNRMCRMENANVFLDDAMLPLPATPPCLDATAC